MSLRDFSQPRRSEPILGGVALPSSSTGARWALATLAGRRSSPVPRRGKRAPRSNFKSPNRKELIHESTAHEVVVAVCRRRREWHVELVRFATANQPLGITTAFENTAALAEKEVAPQVEQSNPYFQKKAEEGKPPKIDWEWMLVIGVFAGAWISSRLSGDRTERSVPPLWGWRFGKSKGKRLAAAFGVLGMLYGALAYVAAFPALQGLINGFGDWEKITLSQLTGISSWVFVAGLAIMAVLLRVFAERRREIHP